MLNRANENHKEGIKYNKHALKKEFNEFKLSLPFMKEVNAHAVSNGAIDKLNSAFQRFFSKLAKYPKFKSKKDKQSFMLTGSEIKYDKENRRVHIPRIGWLKMREAIRFDYTKIYRITVSSRAGRWFVSFSLEIADDRKLCENQATAIGIDIGISKSATCSDGTIIANPRISNTYSVRLRKLNKELSRRTKGGRNWWKTVYKLQRLHAKIADIRSDYIHKETSSIAGKYGIVCLEDLNVKGMVRNHKLARHILDVSFGEIRRQFEYKAFNEVRYVPRFFPSSKMCSGCSAINEMPLSERMYICSCGLSLDRDLNAAINIRTHAVSSTGGKKPTVKTALALSQDKVKQSHG
jgi:putative transposase